MSNPVSPVLPIQPNKYNYALSVLQQPLRARMCGFGDKDRRPITPPLCVRLQLFELVTGLEPDISKVDTSFYVLTVELWSSDHSQPLNLVLHPSTQTIIPAISRQNLFPPTNSRDCVSYGQTYAPPGAQHYHNIQTQSSPVAYMRNLIGNLVGSAFKLTDTDGKLGIWFIFQDLSVRTEGKFTLKFSFYSLGVGQRLNTGKSPVLAEVFSQPFTVYSAKRFPGMIESTPLSKCFAAQGIKIPIRKDGAKYRKEDEEE
ncbi:hypothetical protein NEOLI_002961 [Neolecta irregularis DAH-3]|uniref:Velvet domain-containing protein n=1 Tax=Neolecta irregularis (strain DAH-3) TaxID=1198029 RepID=A0A1U7LME0_NEOID|nr:hypothetical protein NEOLI_002961 [Neolecta irregularis DAH-3]|eukprot:OLL23712.1 hypothetical protein NEOLI_002961 [Neolecta irregularis DAH-3]